MIILDSSRKVNKQGLTEEEFLRAYDPNKFERPSVTVDMLVFTVAEEKKSADRKKKLKLLMVKRGDHPCIGQWALPGGFINMDENLDEAAMRELKEETNVDNIYMEQLYTWGDVGRDPRTRIISTSYISLVNSRLLDVKANDDADDARWMTVSCELFQEQRTVTGKTCTHEQLYRLALSNEEVNVSAVVKKSRIIEGRITKVKWDILETNDIAFDHAKIIMYGLENLRNKVENTDIAFILVPDLFTLSELKEVYEAILDRKISDENFRDKISGMVVETDKYAETPGEEKEKLFTYNPK